MIDYHYPRNLVYGQWDLDIDSISESIKGLLPGKMFLAKTHDSVVSLEFEIALDPAEVTTLDQIVADNRAAFSPLPAAKEIKFQEIDARTVELVNQGFTFPPGSGMVFSLSIPGQIKLLGIEVLRNDPAMVYPIRFNTIDDRNAIDLANATAVHNMALTAFGTYRGYVDSGSALKDQVRACTTVDQVNAIVDPR